MGQRDRLPPSAACVSGGGTKQDHAAPYATAELKRKCLCVRQYGTEMHLSGSFATGNQGFPRDTRTLLPGGPATVSTAAVVVGQ